jgi:hypothetical protein
MSSLLISRSVVVNAPAADIFDLLADPSRHHEIDGSGTVKAAHPDAPKRLANGVKFGMQMKLGAPYKITNEVVEFEEGRRVAWRHVGHHVWRWELEPLGDGDTTKVTETFDGTVARLPLALSLSGVGKRNAKAIDQTLRNLQERFAGQSGGRSW